MENRHQEIERTFIGSALSFSFNAFFGHILQWFKALLLIFIWMIPGILAGGLTVQTCVGLLGPIFSSSMVIIPNWMNNIGIFYEQYTLFASRGYPDLIMGAIIGLLTIFYLSAMHLGVRRLLINYYDNGEIVFRPVFDLRMVLSNVVASLMLLLLIVGGIILFIIPGIIVMLRLLFTGLFIVDKNMGPIEAIQASWAITKGNSNITLGLLIMVIAVSTLIPIAGIFMAGLMIVYAYRELGKSR